MQELREDNGWTQQDVSDKLDIGRSALAKYETGMSSVPHDILLKLANLYNVNIDYLYGHTRIRTSWKDLTTKIQYENGEIALDALVAKYKSLSLHNRRISLEVLESLVSYESKFK